MQRLRILTTVGVIALTILGAVASATTLSPPPKMSHLAGTWLGPSDSLAYVRLEVNSSGQGLLVIQEDIDGSMSLYKIKSTTLSRHDISLSLEPIDKADPTIRMNGKAYFGNLALVRSGINHGTRWQQNISLEREDYLLPRIKAVQQASTAFHTQQRR